MKYLAVLLLFLTQYIVAEELPNPLTLGDALRLSSTDNNAQKQLESRFIPLSYYCRREGTNNQRKASLSRGFS